MITMNIEQARFNMVEQQVRTWEVLDQQVLDLMMQIPREEFVPPAFRNLAFADIHVPLDHEQVMMSPKVEGRLVQSLTLSEQDKVLEIGTGSGYVTALLAGLAAYVETVEIYPDFTQRAKACLDKLDIKNVNFHNGDAINGWNPERRYDAIVLTGSVPILKPHFQQQLAVGGRLFAIVGSDPAMQACLITRLSPQEWTTEVLFETSLPKLIGAPEPEVFVF